MYSFHPLHYATNVVAIANFHDVGEERSQPERDTGQVSVQRLGCNVLTHESNVLCKCVC
jgi:hypothetical protein